MNILNYAIIVNVAMILIAGFLLEHETAIKQHRKQRKTKKIKKGN